MLSPGPRRRGRSSGSRPSACARTAASIDVSVKFSPIFDASNAIVGVSAIARDITPLVARHQEIAEREERIRLLLDSTAEAIYGIDLNGICTFCNPACARLLGYDSPAALIGKQMHPLDPPHASPTARRTRRSSRRSTTRCATAQEAHVDDEVLWRADGTSFPAEYWSHPICATTR